MMRIGLLIIGIFVVAGLLGPLLIGDAGLHINLSHELQGTEAGRLGYAENGVDVLTSLIYGARVSLLVAFVVTFISLVLGIAFGTIAGFFGKHVDLVMMRFVDILLAFPGLLLAIYIAAILRPSLTNVVLALCATGWIGYARVARAQVLSLKNREFILAATSLGASKLRIIIRHIIPNLIGPLVVQATFGLSGAILGEAALSFLGLGVPPGTPSWGALLEQGLYYLFVAPHLAIFPGICIALCVLGFNLLGDALRDAWD